jgi:trigger factor
MQVSVQSGEGLERHMVVELPREDIEQEVEKRLKKLAKTLRINGFRPGKVPAKIVRSRYAAKTQQDVCEDLMQSSYEEALSKEQLRPAGALKIDRPMELNSWDEKNFSYAVSFEILPEIPTNASLSDHTVNRPVVEITDADVDELVESFRLQHADWEIVNRAAQKGDRITVSLEDITPDKLKDAEQDLVIEQPIVLGSSDMYSAIEDGIVGMSAGESRSFTLPSEDTEADPKVVNVTIKNISQPILPELNADFFKKFEIEEDNIEEFRKSIRDGMEVKLEEQIKNLIKRQVMDILLATYQPAQLPKILVAQQKKVLREDSNQEADNTLNDELVETLASRRVAMRLIINDIAQRHNIMPDAELVQRTIDEIAETYEDESETVRHYEEKEERAAIENLVLEDQIVDWVLSEVKVEDTPTPFSEVMAAEGI